SMRVEWAKARARKLRWGEEYQLILEEMRRSVAYLFWKAKWWRERENGQTEADSALLGGINAYAQKQATMLERLTYRFCEYWVPTLRKAG
ncbi:hypothetical protein FA13DRAFT_1589212, partial [Coprinellus micaceus]